VYTNDAWLGSRLRLICRRCERDEAEEVGKEDMV